MPAPVSLEEATVGARLAPADGQYILEADSETISEADLLLTSESYVVTGEPGGGKTTTIKRIAQILLQEPDRSEAWQYPLIVLLRDLPKNQSLIAHIAALLGLRFEIPKVEQLETISYVVRCGDEPLIRAVARGIEETGAVLLLDGLDEVDLTERKHVESEIQDLIQLLANGKLLLSARTGSVERVFENVRRVQVAPLTRAQALAIAERWLPDSTAFFQELDRMPYYDLARRPLFLIRLLLIFRRLHSLPNQPCDIYDRFIRLLLEDWDRERDVTRSSRYANFGPDQKMRFLASLSHHLLMETRSVSFSRFELERAYLRLSEQFNLPELQAERVIAEIISHTGLIVAARFGHYEFSHLSLQEYLCAHHIVRDPVTSNLGRYLASYPAPLAIATTMAANPSAFLASLVLTREPAQGTSWDIYLQRLAYERPRFVLGDLIGLSALKIISDNVELANPFLNAFKANNDEAVLLKSIGLALRAYAAAEILPLGWIVFHKTSTIDLPSPLTQPSEFRIRETLVQDILEHPGITLFSKSKTGLVDTIRIIAGRIVLAKKP